MTRRIATIFGSMIALSAAITRPALADIYYVTYTGTASGTDTYGVFGTAGATLSNAAFTSTYTFNSSQIASSGQYTYADQTNLYGGTDYPGYTDPILSAIIKINGASYSQASTYIGDDYLQGGDLTPFISTQANSSSSNYLYNPCYLPTSPTYSVTAVQSFACSSPYGAFVDNSESISLTDTHVSITDGPPATVPEPTSLALLSGLSTMFGLTFAASKKLLRKQRNAQSS